MLHSKSLTIAHLLKNHLMKFKLYLRVLLFKSLHQTHPPPHAEGLMDIKASRELQQGQLLTRSDLVEGDALRHAAPQGHAHSLKQLLFAEKVLVSREHLSKAQSSVCPRRDGDLQNVRWLELTGRTQALKVKVGQCKVFHRRVSKQLSKSVLSPFL